MPTRNKILGVDDNPTNIEILRELLSEDYNFRSAQTGEEALTIAADFKPDLILLDIMLPGIDGYEVCRRLRTNSVLRFAKIIMVSAKAMTTERLMGYQAGADDYIVKPFDEYELMAKIQVYLGLKPVEEMNELKTSMLSLISHESRTPLHGILGPAQMLMAGGAMAEEERISLAEMIYDSARLLNAFFEKVILLGTLKNEKIPWDFKSDDLCLVVRAAVNECLLKAKERNVTIRTDIPEQALAVINREKIKRVVTILLDNAIRFSPADFQVHVTLRKDNETFCLSVKDQGVGIDSIFLPHVFDELASIDIAHHTTGHGLSLAIARQIILRHNGAITVESEMGKGTKFTVRLPADVSEKCPTPEPVSLG